MDQNACVIFCRCGTGTWNTILDEISEGLKTLDVHVFELQDLCAISLHEKDFLNELANDFHQKIVVACYPRAVKNLLSQAGVNPSGFEVLSFKELSPRQILTELSNKYHIQNGKALVHVQVSKLEVPAWFPVIDASLCSLCGKCARFCLFGVYAYDKKSLKVVNPLACKNNCPACGRACPTSAVIFPRLDERTALAGAEPGSREIKTGGNDLIMMLKDRNKVNNSIFRQGVLLQAEEERRKAVEEIKSAFIDKRK